MIRLILGIDRREGFFNFNLPFLSQRRFIFWRACLEKQRTFFFRSNRGALKPVPKHFLKISQKVSQKIVPKIVLMLRFQIT
jgi:hypothetical protein